VLLECLQNLCLHVENDDVSRDYDANSALFMLDSSDDNYQIITANFIPNESVPEISVFPNPFENKITIKSSIDEELEIFNYLGQKVDELKIEIGENKLQFTKNSNGIYLLKFKKSGRIVKLVSIKN
jgi:hypothetical protein